MTRVRETMELGGMWWSLGRRKWSLPALLMDWIQRTEGWEQSCQEEEDREKRTQG